MTSALEVPAARLHVEVQGPARSFCSFPAAPAGRHTGRHAGRRRAPAAGRARVRTGRGVGNSAGAITALELVARHPEQVHTLVAHEPPVTELLDEPAHHRRRNDELRAVHRDHGTLAALTRFLADTGMGEGMPAPPSPQDPSEQAALGRMMSNLDMFVAHVVGPISRDRPDIEALRAASTRIVVAGGAESVGQAPWRAADALASALSSPLVQLPGDHSGFVSRPDEFAAALGALLSDHRRSSV